MAQETDAHGIPLTALRQDYAFKAVDDYNVRMYILPHLVDPESRAKIIAEHKADPLYSPTRPGAPAPMYSQVLVRLIDKLRVTPQAGKHTIVETTPNAEYTIALLPETRGGTVELTDETYPTRGEADHAIFLKRLKALLAEYGVEI
jgi:hypothetical protein